MATLPYDPAFDRPVHDRQSSLWPREHGTYVQLLAPLLAAMFVRSPTIAGVLLAITASAAFLGTEAVLVSSGGRGRRRQRVDGARAVHRARLCSAIAAGAGVAGLLLAPRAAIELVGLVALPAVLAIALATRRKLHSFIGEQIAALALIGASVPVLAASDVARNDALVWWLIWMVGFAASVGAVRSVIAQRPRQTEAVDRADSPLFVFLVASLLAITAHRIAVALPLLFVSGVIQMIAPSAKHLSTVRVVLAITAACSAALAITFW